MITRRHTLAVLAAFSTTIALSSAATAAESACGMHHMDSPIKVEAPFARASASPAVKSGGGYLKITNAGDTPDRLIAAEGDVARRIELHTTRMQDGVMHMMEIDGGVEIAPGETAEFKPGGNHIMMMGLNAPLVKGEAFCLTLVFEKAGKVMVSFPILGVGAMEGGMDHSGHGAMTE